jgi:hypothetical protein
LMGELTLAPKHSGLSTKWERRIFQVKSRSRVLVRSGNCTEKMGFGASSAFGKGFGLWFLVTRGALGTNSNSLAARTRIAGIEKPLLRYVDEFKGSVKKLRFQAMRLYAKAQPNDQDAKIGALVDGCLKFLTDSKKVCESMEAIITNFSHPSCESKSINAQLGWFRQFRLCRERDALNLTIYM